MSDSHIELILEALPGADRQALLDALRVHGFDPTPMKVGILLSADVKALRKLLPTLSGAEAREVEIPKELQESVRSIRIVRPRSFHTP